MNILSKLLDLIYPPKCIFCEEIIVIGQPKWICEKCRDNIEIISGHRCLKCGKPLDNTDNLCKICLQYQFLYKKGYCLLYYDGFTREAIHRFKYNNHPEYAKGFSKLIYEYSEDKSFFEADCFIPVPMFPKKRKKRGFNQAELIAYELSKLTNIPIFNDVLFRIKDTKKQSQLNFAERKNNVKNAFKAQNSAKITNKNILLIDDIYTTGSTINECADVLIKEGAKNVYSYCLSIVKDKKIE